MDLTESFVQNWDSRMANQENAVAEFRTLMIDYVSKMNDSIESIVARLAELQAQRKVKDYYSPNEFAEIVGLSPDTVREHLRNRRILGEHRHGTGRGNKPEWRISHAELERYRSDGLRPRPAFVV